MLNFSIFFLGEANAGKSQLVERLATYPNFFFNKEYIPTMRARHFKLQIQDKRLHLWDYSGQKIYETFSTHHIKSSLIIVYCVDLTEKINSQKIIDDIAAIQRQVPFSYMLIIGTKASDSSLSELANLQNITKVPVIITSAETGFGIEELKNAFIHLCSQYDFNKQLDKITIGALTTFTESIKKIFEEKQKIINEAVQQLIAVLFDVEIIDKSDAIKTFQQTCRDQLIKYKLAQQIFYAALAILLITILSLIIGFTLGFALGLWLTPAILMISLCSIVGLLSGGFTFYQLHQVNEANEPMENFFNELENNYLNSNN